MTTDLFNSDEDTNTPAIDPNKDYFSELVGEGKKYKDTPAAGRALVEKDAFIEKLKSEAAGLRQELNTRLRLEEAVEKITSANRGSPSSEPTPPAHEQAQEDKSLTPEDIRKMLRDELAQDQKKTQAQKNVEYVEKELQDAFGPTFRRTLKEQSAKLGLGEDFLKNLAAEQPNAFLKLFDVSPGQKRSFDSPSVPHTSVNSEALGFQPSAGTKRKSHYDNIRKSDPKRYWSVAVQNEIHREALKQGESFFDK